MLTKVYQNMARPGAQRHTAMLRMAILPRGYRLSRPHGAGRERPNRDAPPRHAQASVTVKLHELVIDGLAVPGPKSSNPSLMAVDQLRS